MIHHGTNPHKLDKRDHALHRTFPQFGAVYGTQEVPNSKYNYDAGLGMANQLEIDTRFSPALPPIPFGCTGETSSDICGDEDKAIYDPQYTYERACDMEGHGYNQGADIRTSMKSLTVYGLRRNGETQVQAQMRKRGKYYTIDKIPKRDWFDSFRLALRGNGRSISVGVPWFTEWGFGNVGPDGLLTANFVYDGEPEHYGWHDVKVSGEDVLYGEPVLLVKSWQGATIGDRGWLKWNRETFNKAYDIYGTFSATPGLPVQPAEIQYVKLTLKQYLLTLYNRLLAALGGYPVPIYA